MTLATRTLTSPIAMRVLCLLRHGARGFNDLQRSVEVDRATTFSKLLKKLQRDGVLTREVLKLGPPARTLYHLTDAGKELAEPVAALCTWLARNESKIMASRQASNSKREAERAADQAADATTERKRSAKRPALSAEAR